MENAPPVPPLFCSTPPPIDFNDDEIEDCDFGVADIDEAKIDVPPAAEFSTTETRLEDCCYIPSSSPPPFDLTAEQPEEDTTNLVEAINVDSIQKIAGHHDFKSDIDIAEDELKYPEQETTELDSENNCAIDIIPEIDNNKLDSAFSSCSDKSPIPKEADFKSLVSLEDVSDDSDNEYLQKVCRNVPFEESDPNFFAIQVVQEASDMENDTGIASVNEAEAKNVVDDCKEAASDTLPQHKDELCSENLPNVDDDEISTKVPQITEEKYVLCSDDVFGSSDNFDDPEWGDVQFASASGEELHIQKLDIEAPTTTTIMTINDECCDKALENTTEPIVCSNENKCNNDVVAVDDDFDDDDDDFGDFAAVTLAPAQQTPVQNAPPHSAPIENVANCSNSEPESAESSHFDASKRSLEHMKPLLANIFPLTASIDECATAYEKSLNRLPMESVDSANALNYQWKNSETRSCLIRSLGIDSRNILYGEKWNPSMPRFAANLSFDPLKPIKPQLLGGEQSSEPPSHHTVLNPQVTNDLKECGQKLEVDIIAEKLAVTNITTSTTTIIPDTIEIVGSNSKLTVDMASLTVTDKLSSTIPVVEMETPDMVAGNVSQLPSHVETNYLAYEATSSLENILYTNAIAASQPTTRTESVTNSLSLTTDDFASDASEVVTTSTFAGPLKETHIYTPSKYDETIAVTLNGPIPSNLSPKPEPIDFDYEKAAAGIIIDETVVKKEYRDIEYNPGFSLELNLPIELNGTNTLAVADAEPTMTNACNADQPATIEPAKNISHDLEDDFSEFQSVPPPPAPAHPIGNAAVKIGGDSMPKVGDEMILCPSILLPQAISIGETKPKVEWGDSVACINPEELARIEELFPQNHAVTQTKTPLQQHHHQQQHQLKQQQSPTISGRIAQQEKHNCLPADEDDDWSDFLSVPITNANNMPKLAAAPTQQSILHLHQNTNTQQKSKMNVGPAPAVDDEWSDFVSNTPVPNETNFYKATNISNNNNTNKYLQNKTHHIVHDFSTLPTPRQQHNNHHHHHHHHHNHQQTRTFQHPAKGVHGGMPTKLVPNISVIPTLGFSSSIMTKPTYTTKK